MKAIAENSFHQLEPELILHATHLAGFSPTGEFTQLNSYENRVFDLRTEDPAQPRLIAKFYRPGRWNREALLEEHAFLTELKKEGLHAVAPLVQKNNSTVNFLEGMYVSFFPKVSGRMPTEFLGNDLKSVGRQLAQLHNIGARQTFQFRPIIGEYPWTPWETLEYLSQWVAPELWPRYETAAQILIENLADHIDSSEFIRIHGDCHRGNLLNTASQKESEFFFVDFDDTCMGPVSQDLWMLMSSFQNEDEQDLLRLGYEEFREFPTHQLQWMPLLRGLRVLQYAAWIARRWEDPSFPRLFPEFNTYNYWAEEVENLEKVVSSL